MGEFEDKLGLMRDKCQGDAAYVEFLRETVLTAKTKEAIVGSTCPFFQTKAACPFAKDTNAKPILSPDYIVVCYYKNHLRYTENVAPSTSHIPQKVVFTNNTETKVVLFQ